MTEKKNIKVTLRLSEKEYDRIKQFAKASGKTFSEFCREKIKEGIEREKKEVILLDKLIKSLQSIENFMQKGQGERGQSGSMSEQGLDKNVQKILLANYLLLKKLGEYVIALESKRKQFKEDVERLERFLGVKIEI